MTVTGCRSLARPLALLALFPPAAAQEEAPPLGLEAWPPAEAARQLEAEDALLATVDNGRLRRWHDLLASVPHVAGSEGDLQVVDAIAGAFEGMGLEVERHEFWAWLGIPRAAALEVVAPERVALPLGERALPEDPWSADDTVRTAWNGYSGSGDVTAEVVYANYGREEDFERLRELGVDCTGTLVVARYGGNYRGFKAKFAQEAGAVGLVIYTDPADSGWAKGLPWPAGGWANETSVQRGSIKTLPYQGDPLTPFVEATREAQRLAPSAVALPEIPVQPVGWGAAQEILGRMQGESVPAGWQGGLPFRYRLTGGPGLRVRLMVDQPRELVRSYNVTGTLRGRELPQQRVVIGAHHDAWGFGAGDPTSGTICVMEVARAFAQAAAQGRAPRRSITFAAWGAEEHGIIGSTEWVEARVAELSANAVAYLNLDMASMGPQFSASASPSLQRLLAGAAARVPQARAQDGRSVLDDWRARGANAGDPTLPAVGDLGGGSDHVAFLAHAGVPSAGLHGGGSDGSSYHSLYDDLAWYRAVVGEDYEPARMVAEVTAVAAARLAEAPVVPLAVARYGPEVRRHLRALTAAGRARGRLAAGEGEAVAPELARLDALAAQLAQAGTDLARALEEALRGGGLSAERRARLDRELIGLERLWLDPAGLPGRPWYRSLFAAPDESSGYAAWILPGLQHALTAEAAPESLAREERRLRGVLEALVDGLRGMEGALAQDRSE